MKFYQLLKEFETLQKAFIYVVNNNGKATFNPYHNINHMMVVTEYIYQYGVDVLTNKELEELLIVGIFHDFQHTAGAQKDYINIKLASNGIKDFLEKKST